MGQRFARSSSWKNDAAYFYEACSRLSEIWTLLLSALGSYENEAKFTFVAGEGEQMFSDNVVSGVCCKRSKLKHFFFTATIYNKDAGTKQFRETFAIYFVQSYYYKSIEKKSINYFFFAFIKQQ